MAEPPAKRAKRTDSAAMWESHHKSSNTADRNREPRTNGQLKEKRDRGGEDNHHHGHDGRKRRSRSRSRERARDRERRRDRSKSRDRGGRRYTNGNRSRSPDRDGRKRPDEDRKRRDRSLSKERHRSNRGESYDSLHNFAFLPSHFCSDDPCHLEPRSVESLGWHSSVTFRISVYSGSPYATFLQLKCPS